MNVRVSFKPNAVAASVPGPNTNAVHAGDAPDPRHGGVVPDIVNSTTFRYPEREDGSEAPYIYTRYDNPTLQAAEAKVAALEGAARSCVFASGLAAETTIFQAMIPDRGHVAVVEGAYGGTTALLRDAFETRGVTVTTFAPDDPAGVPEAADLMWLESITNPLLRVPDIPAFARRAADVGAKLAVDSTFASPALQRPLELGADIVMHSGTKYLNGHADVTAGVVATNDTALAESIWTHRRNLRATLDPIAAYLLARGMKTLPLRMERHCKNAMALAEACTSQTMVQRTMYPGLTDHPDHERAGRLLRDGYGGMLTLDLGTLERAKAFRRNTRIITPAASLGGVESLVSLPRETSHAYATAEQRAADGITDGLVRISVGIEGIDDLIADVNRALAAAEKA